MDKVLLCVFLFFLVNGDVVFTKFTLTNVGEDKIVGGEDTTIDMYPYQVFVSISNGTVFSLCGGSIISPRYILTAAHCLRTIAVKRLVVVAGSTDAYTGAQEIRSKMFYIHPMFNNNTLDYDVAIIKLRTKLDIDDVTTKVIELPNTRDVPNGEDLIVTGWGAVDNNGTSADDLKVVTIQTISSNICRNSYSFLTRRMFCAGVPEGGKGSCQGDSGGPAVLSSNNMQVGIVSFGRKCGSKDDPSVFTRVGEPDIRNWISNIAKV